jgi:anti-anti-sigma factor
VTDLLLTQSDEPGRAVVRLSGELDMATAPKLAQAVAEAVQRAPCVVLDLSALEFCDSTGLNALVDARHHSHNDGFTLLLRDPGPQVRRLLELTRLEGAFDVEDGQGT